MPSNLPEGFHRIYLRISAVISTLGYLPLWGNSKFYFRVKSLPGVYPKPPYGLILDSTVGCK